MVWYLRKYETTSGRTSIADPTSDIFDLKGVRFGGQLFDETIIATKTELGDLTTVVTNIQTQLTAHIEQNDIDIGANRTDIESLYALLALYGNDLNRLIGDLPVEERLTSTAGQTVFVASIVRWSPDHAIQDVLFIETAFDLHKIRLVELFMISPSLMGIEFESTIASCLKMTELLSEWSVMS